MNIKLNALILVGCLSMVWGCGLLGSKGVAKEQLNADIADKSVKVKDGTDWFFKFDSERCFAVNDEESKITAANADISVTVASWREIGIDKYQFYRTVFGKVLLHYKNDGGKWVLESLEPKDLTEKTLETEEFKKFLDIRMPICNYFRYTN
jgi:hypothetical protein